ncbi:hypothetical protein GPECTOR_606g684 [Gonium pectorale]|uniref:Uncharacterized protein n=1 Tax=Gonium pectorale TaxID=33097 RepID=A0A150FUH8_GONPE|nr:hypothetical protein GPECTOR_606g684 [Gonium pectorale]|eukprot:KXZ41252.1 hypothetical protein GPECTOR_606g684 [Gonium pectorale]
MDVSGWLHGLRGDDSGISLPVSGSGGLTVSWCFVGGDSQDGVDDGGNGSEVAGAAPGGRSVNGSADEGADTPDASGSVAEAAGRHPGLPRSRSASPPTAAGVELSPAPTTSSPSAVGVEGPVAAAAAERQQQLAVAAEAAAVKEPGGPRRRGSGGGPRRRGVRSGGSMALAALAAGHAALHVFYIATWNRSRTRE